MWVTIGRVEKFGDDRPSELGGERKRSRGVATGDILVFTPKISPSKLFMG